MAVNITTSSQAVYTQHYACVIKGEQFPMIFIIQQLTKLRNDYTLGVYACQWLPEFTLVNGYASGVTLPRSSNRIAHARTVDTKTCQVFTLRSFYS